MDRNIYACHYQLDFHSILDSVAVTEYKTACLPVYSKEMHLLQLQVHIQDIFHNISFIYQNIHISVIFIYFCNGS